MTKPNLSKKKVMNKGYLNKFSTGVIKKEGDYIVNYQWGNSYGHCIYSVKIMSGVNKPLRQSVLIMTHCQMGEIISSINEDTPLTDKDRDELTREIREHSKRVLTNFLSSNGEGPY